jgi:hypothetical protein
MERRWQLRIQATFNRVVNSHLIQQSELNDLVQCFSNFVPRNTEVLRRSAKGFARECCPLVEQLILQRLCYHGSILNFICCCISPLSHTVPVYGDQIITYRVHIVVSIHNVIMHVGRLTLNDTSSNTFFQFTPRFQTWELGAQWCRLFIDLTDIKSKSQWMCSVFIFLNRYNGSLAQNGNYRRKWKHEVWPVTW